ncbi:unnamed protein product [Allacma fusca]|uniref:C-type lectin domain-containing protein n=1 Tax=Allacma fusca TaxID=39272 RepID=A0A8J2J7P8_9HEXA|nr:unnamed protein product [Allacma fusca]
MACPAKQVLDPFLRIPQSDPSLIPSKMQLQTQILVGLCACVAFVQCQEQVTVGKVGTKTFILLEGTENVDWDTSESLCKAKGLQLAALENSRENDLVSAFVVKRAPITKLSAVHVCLGGSDKKSEGKWYWAGSNKHLTYTNWAENQPTESNYYNCMMMAPVGDNKKAKWQSNYCDNAQCRPLCQSV